MSPVCTMLEPSVCDLAPLMRTRLLCGLYNSRSVSPRWRRLAQAYCLTIAFLTSLYIYFAHSFWNFWLTMFMLPSFVHYYISFFVSFWTGDEYIYKFFNRSKSTDVTLDSTMIFSHLEKRVKQVHYYIVAHFVVVLGLMLPSVLYNSNTGLFLVVLPVFVLDLFLAFAWSTNLLIMALFDARILVLKRRLQRYGFRAIGRAQPQPYCQIYEEILQKLDAIDNPLKFLLFFDLICNCSKIIGLVAYHVSAVHWQNPNGIVALALCFVGGLTTIKRLVCSFGHVAYLESAAAHCSEMEIFTVTELIKVPSVEERRRMREFLGALEHRGARYHVLRALPLDARLALRVLGFCTTQIIVIVTMVTSNKFKDL